MAAEVLSLLRAALRDPGAATLKALASKALGLGVVAGSAVLKIPQARCKQRGRCTNRSLCPVRLWQ